MSKDGLVRHFFHRPWKAYTTGTRKRQKVHSDEDGGETRWHKTGKTRPVLANGRPRGYKKILYHLGSDEEERDGELVASKVFFQTQPRQCGSTATKEAAATMNNNYYSGANQDGSFLKEAIKKGTCSCCSLRTKLHGVSKDGLVRHFFHRPWKAYTTGTRKWRKVHNDEDGGETRWHKTGKTWLRKQDKTNWVIHQYHLGSDEEEWDGELVASKVFFQTAQAVRLHCRQGGRRYHE
ncbi:hypothetical protein GUJ93_ZPchr0005g15971 [Zizania palustris]|uniref:NAC domain-containing protein n=1 Tax=Zizania palustris TaxID=103762 RepID=A0A8J5VGG3_ZIZPA|nr:hypothetical protein GUJ93_ZPchr0005g15971 [Zizania palustris]